MERRDLAAGREEPGSAELEASAMDFTATNQSLKVDAEKVFLQIVGDSTERIKLNNRRAVE